MIIMNKIEQGIKLAFGMLLPPINLSKVIIAVYLYLACPGHHPPSAANILLLQSGVSHTLSWLIPTLFCSPGDLVH